jgi:hypothetical protein
MVRRVLYFPLPPPISQFQPVSFVATTDQEALPGSPSLPTSSQSHLRPLSPLVHEHQRGDGPSSPRSPTIPLSSPFLRRRHLTGEHDHLQKELGLEFSPFDAASIFSMPSMLSLHSHVEGVTSRHEEKEVHIHYSCISCTPIKVL